MPDKNFLEAIKILSLLSASTVGCCLMLFASLRLLIASFEALIKLIKIKELLIEWIENKDDFNEYMRRDRT
jgi:hypothetical protein